MNTKALLLAALVGAAAVSANAGVRFGISVGLPLPVVAAPVVVAPPVVPVVAAPVAAVAAPPCPGVGFVYAPGYWGYRGGARCWFAGGWYRPGPAFHGGYYHGGFRR